MKGRHPAAGIVAVYHSTDFLLLVTGAATPLLQDACLDMLTNSLGLIHHTAPAVYDLVTCIRTASKWTKLEMRVMSLVSASQGQQSLCYRRPAWICRRTAWA